MITMWISPASHLVLTRDPGMQIWAGEIVCLARGSGSGKTTVLRVITGLSRSITERREVRVPAAVEGAVPVDHAPVESVTTPFAVLMVIIFVATLRLTGLEPRQRYYAGRWAVIEAYRPSRS